jgi:hypothetical protein
MLRLYRPAPGFKKADFASKLSKVSKEGSADKLFAERQT